MKTFKELITPKILINSAISGGLVLFGACTSGVTLAGLGVAIAAGCVAFLTQLRADLFPKSKLGELRLFSIY